jgi:Domain of unknown function (DUF397)
MTDSESRRFVKSSWSGGNGGDCVDWAVGPGGVHVCDSKDRFGVELFFTHAEWDDLAAKAASGDPHESISVVGHGVRWPVAAASCSSPLPSGRPSSLARE